ncbi:MAG: winged helix-turn-helix domain-containing protein [Candidatus Thermoplasmatota archaeon]|jgi:DNA-binding transcriptional ArsR family regulator|nr:winged helix-turn-helix domain-containing protein [Candidatus Thermoplasmatota archaeon]
MTKITIDMNTFKALASDTRLNILKALDGKKLSLNDICKATNLNKATLHEHLKKLYEAGLVKKNEREGHKWVYYKLTWKGEGLLHPENTKIVVMFSITFISLLIGVMLLANFAQPIILGMAETYQDTVFIYKAEDEGIFLISRDYDYQYIGEVDAKEKTVANITKELQIKAPTRNIFGEVYNEEEIQWITPDNQIIENNQYILSSVTYFLNESTNNSDDEFNNLLNDIGTNNDTINNTINNVEDNKTLGRSFNFYPAVPEMIAVVYDQNLLYLSIFCLTFFAFLFIISTWKFIKNRKSKL